MIRTEGVKMERSRRAWTLYEGSEALCTVGLMDRTLLGSRVELWFVLHEGFLRHKRKGLKFLRRGIRRILYLYKSMRVHVDSSSTKSCRFVQYFGFKYVTSVSTIDRKVFNVFELRM